MICLPCWGVSNNNYLRKWIEAIEEFLQFLNCTFNMLVTILKMLLAQSGLLNLTPDYCFDVCYNVKYPLNY